MTTRRTPTSASSTGCSTRPPSASAGPASGSTRSRYADTRGYEKDAHREIWPYRDWVIRAINDDLPFDQFTIEQIAGDLLPDATPDQRLATAMHRNTMNNDEGGTDDEEFRVAAVMDRVETTMQVWLGLTATCARCHTHKYDPITQHEYFELYAFFNQTADADTPDESPTMPVLDEDDDRRDALIARARRDRSPHPGRHRPRRAAGGAVRRPVRRLDR